jgi:hypothetical protein
VADVNSLQDKRTYVSFIVPGIHNLVNSISPEALAANVIPFLPGIADSTWVNCYSQTFSENIEKTLSQILWFS